jgi:hypothetical protein
MTSTLAFVILLSLAQDRPVADPSAVTAEDLAVIDAALSHKARNALNLARPRGTVLLIDRPLGPCPDEKRSSPRCFPHGERTVTFVRRRIATLTQDRLDALAARNAGSHVLRPFARDIVLVAQENLIATIKKYKANVTAATSLPVYFDDGTALIFLEFACGGRCGEGNFLLLRRRGDRWKVEKTAMTWIS